MLGGGGVAVGVRVCAMRLLSWNVRGLGGLEKRKEVMELVKENMSFVLCLQETKMQLIDDFLRTSVWGQSNHDYSYCSSVEGVRRYAYCLGYFRGGGVGLGSRGPPFDD